MTGNERRDTWDRSAIAWGIVFTVLGIGFLLEALDVWDLRPEVIWPSLLIGLGLAVILGGTSDR
jgi:hypothetical protein